MDLYNLVEVYLVRILLDTLNQRPNQMYWLTNWEVQELLQTIST